jgi:D-inositol-3-phosphate glycosyltransferase
VYVVEGDWLGVFLALLRSLISFRWIVSVHDPEYSGVRLGYPGEPSSRWREAAKRWVLRSADGVRTNSHVTRDVLVQGGIAPELIEVIPLHCTARMLIDGDIHSFRQAARREILQRHALPLGCELIVAACRLTPIKGLDLAIRAFARVLADRPTARFLICGGDRVLEKSGSYRAVLERVAQECGVASCLAFAGNVDPAGVKRYYAAADLHVVSSYIETFNYSAVEAALAGTATLMTDRIGAGHWLAKAGAALIVKGHGIDDFAAAMARGLARAADAQLAPAIARGTAEELALPTVSAHLESMLFRQLPAAARASAGDAGART